MLGPSLVTSVQAAYDEPLCFPDVLALADRGDPGPQRILYDAGYALGRALAGTCTMLDPEAVVVDGSLGPAGDHLARGVRDALDRDAAPVVADGLEVVRGQLPDAELAGAVALARSR